jgi:hypothetical protein
VAGPSSRGTAEGMADLDDAEEESEVWSWNGDGLEPEEAEAWNKEAARWVMGRRRWTQTIPWNVLKNLSMIGCTRC